MVIDPAYFVVANERKLSEGMCVRTKHGPGTLDYIWFGCEEMAWINMDDGYRRCCLSLEMDDVFPLEPDAGGES